VAQKRDRDEWRVQAPELLLAAVPTTFECGQDCRMLRNGQPMPRRGASLKTFEPRLTITAARIFTTSLSLSCCRMSAFHVTAG
jgi:hypothetical protein